MKSPKPKPELVIRSVPRTDWPTYAVVLVLNDGTGRDLAWFYSRKDAEKFIKCYERPN